MSGRGPGHPSPGRGEKADAATLRLYLHLQCVLGTQFKRKDLLRAEGNRWGREAEGMATHPAPDESKV
ncbi:MAG: hypothetical protein IT445_05730 [Phycisphaeraceae bacterium]|nr:hypothetical protein [Phycisphaeraceae bacterium]